MNRTHTCCELTDKNLSERVNIIGWIDSIRDHGGILFIDLRDRTGITQILVDPQTSEEIANISHKLKVESVIEVSGEVTARPKETINSGLKTGKIEVKAENISVHNICETLPFSLEEKLASKVGEELRLKYRYLDLRRPVNYKKLETRHKTSKAIRDFLNENSFLEVELPILFKTTPEGAREFLVPSRLNPNNFYALTQSPQQYKQMLMVGGIERYYSLAKCFRDEDLRSDRQPEFTQVDIELSFTDREEIYKLIESMLQKVWKDVLGIEIKTPFPRMEFNEAMNRYGVDKPDTRFDIELKDFTDLFKDSEFKVFAQVSQKGGSVKAINAKGLAGITQGELKNLEKIAQTLGAKGLAYIKQENGEWKSPILKFLSEEEKITLKEKLLIEDEDIIFFAATKWETACAILGRIRLEAAELLKQKGKLEIPTNQYNFLWVTNFPLLTHDDDEGRLISSHHPFTAPIPEDIKLLRTNPEQIRGQHYDIVLNGTELGGGSIRIHQPEVQKTIFKDILKLPQDIIEKQFGYMLKSFSYGAPPHGGIALGFDRLVAILCGTNNIRDVIAFPKTQKGQDLMSESPSPATKKQLEEVYISMIEDPKTLENCETC